MANHAGPRSPAEEMYMDQEGKWYGTWVQDDNKKKLAAFFTRAKDANKRIGVVHLFLWQEIRILEFLRRKYSTPQYSDIDFLKASEEWSEDEALHKYIWNWADGVDITEEDRTFFTRMLQYWLTKDRAPRKAGYLDDGTISRENLLYRDPFDIGPNQERGTSQGSSRGPSGHNDINQQRGTHNKGKGRQQSQAPNNTNSFGQAPDAAYDSDPLIDFGKDSIPDLNRRLSNLRGFSGPPPADHQISRPQRSGQNDHLTTTSTAPPPVPGQHTRPVNPTNNAGTSFGFRPPMIFGNQENIPFIFKKEVNYGQQQEPSGFSSGQGPNSQQQPPPQQTSQQQQTSNNPFRQSTQQLPRTDNRSNNGPASTTASSESSHQQQQRSATSAQSGSIPPPTGTSGQAPQSRPAAAAQQPHVSPSHISNTTQPASQFSQQATPGFQQQVPPGFRQQAPPGFQQQPPPGFQQQQQAPPGFQRQAPRGFSQQPPPVFQQSPPPSSSQTQGTQYRQSSGHPRQYVQQAPSRPLAQGYGIYQQQAPGAPPHPYRQAQTPEELQEAADARARMSQMTNEQLFNQLDFKFDNLHMQ